MEKDGHIKVTSEISGTGEYNIRLIGHSLPQGRYLIDNGGYLKYGFLKLIKSSEIVTEVLKLLIAAFIGYLIGKI